MFEVSTYHNFEILINPLLLLRAEILQIYVEYSSLNQKYLGDYIPPHILETAEIKASRSFLELTDFYPIIKNLFPK